MKPRFLLDEHLSDKIAAGLKRLKPLVDITYIGAEGVPPKSTLDPDILLWIEQYGYTLVTNNRSSRSGHITDHFAAGRHFPGILLLSKEMSIGELIADLEVIWEASEVEEYFDKIGYIPL